MNEILFSLLFSRFVHMGHVYVFILPFPLKMFNNIWWQFFWEVENIILNNSLQKLVLHECCGSLAGFKLTVIWLTFIYYPSV